MEVENGLEKSSRRAKTPAESKMEAKKTSGNLPLIDEYYGLWLLLSQTRAAVFKARHKMLGKYVHFNQAAALVNIWTNNGRATPAMLSRHLFLDPTRCPNLS
jgi:hypothetical protein